MGAAGEPVGRDAPGFGAIEQWSANIEASLKHLLAAEQMSVAETALPGQKPDDAQIIVGPAKVFECEEFQAVVFLFRQWDCEFEDVHHGSGCVLFTEGSNMAATGLPGFNDGTIIEQEGGVGIL